MPRATAAIGLCLLLLPGLRGGETAIKLDQAGYLPDAPKLAFVVAPAPASSFEVLREADGAVVFKGQLSAPQTDPDTGDPVQVADFTGLTASGDYHLQAPGAGRSWTFRIAADVYGFAYYLAMRSYYGQRCGTAVDLSPGFPGYTHGICHMDGAWDPSSGKTGMRLSSKGWHDAGDYGRYIVNSGITTGTLLWAWELYGDRVRDVSLNIPESGSKVPDILSEIRWNLEWMLSMQDDDGGVWHKQTSAKFPGFVMPEKDESASVVVGTGSEPFKSSCATADFAAVMAIAARDYAPFDQEFAGESLDAARRAWTWLDAHPSVAFRNPPGITTGAYGDSDCSDERLWAAAELWRTTGEDAYHRYFLGAWAAQRAAIRPVGPPSWNSVGALGLWTYVLAGRANADAAAVAAIRQDTLQAADQMVERTARNPYHQSLTAADYVWGSNGVAANYGLELLIAGRFKPDSRYRNAALDNLHYLLGRNTFSLSWVTQLGANPFRHPHHRPSGADTNAEPWPGLLAGGPDRRKQDPAMQKLGDLPPGKMYLDEQDSYATNEVAINWNAPLVFLLAASLPPAP